MAGNLPPPMLLLMHLIPVPPAPPPLTPRLVPEYIGPLNLATHLPPYTITPDLGPKGYIACGREGEGGAGEEGDSVTKMHEDLSDAGEGGREGEGEGEGGGQGGAGRSMQGAAHVGWGAPGRVQGAGVGGREGVGYAS